MSEDWRVKTPRERAGCTHTTLGIKGLHPSIDLSSRFICDDCLKGLLDERDMWREVLRDATEERGITKALSKLVDGLREVQRYLQHASFSTLYAGATGRMEQTSLATARENIALTLRALLTLVRPDEEQKPEKSAKIPAEPCRICSAPAGEACHEGRHGAAWAFHISCGRLMRGGVCDNCSITPPMEQVALVPSREEVLARAREVMRAAGAELQGRNLFDTQAEQQAAQAIAAVDLQELVANPRDWTIGPRDPATTFCGDCGAAPGVRCAFDCPQSPVNQL